MPLPAWRSACLLLVALVVPGFAAAENPPARTVKPFRLPDTDGKTRTLAEFDGRAVVVLFLGTECPINNQYLPTLAVLHREYAAKGVAFVALNSNVHDTPTRVAAHARANRLPFPVLKDSGNVVADDFKAHPGGVRPVPGRSGALSGTHRRPDRHRLSAQGTDPSRPGGRPRRDAGRQGGFAAADRRPRLPDRPRPQTEPGAASPTRATSAGSSRTAARSATGRARWRRCR